MFEQLEALLDKTTLNMTVTKVKGKIAVALTPKSVDGFSETITFAGTGKELDEQFASIVAKEIFGDAIEVMDLLEQQKKLLKGKKEDVAKKTVEATNPKTGKAPVKVSNREVTPELTSSAKVETETANSGSEIDLF